MSITIEVPKEYGYVLLTATSSFFLSMWHGMRVIRFRKAAGIPIPHAYASQQDISAAPSPQKKHDMYLFNCAQRAHANLLENQGSFTAALLIAGLRYPLAATGTGLFWCVSRALYAVGYTRKDRERGRGRVMGSGFWLAQLALIIMSGMAGYGMIKA
ncbi:MAG: hypothetical protein M1813_009289 [Trichoglossum hirsutum]|nr:MAG: hypothetical protein M1813_009289 [Trichoglossum hirsutum]